MRFLRDTGCLQVDDMSWAPVKTKMTLERSYQCAVGLSRSLSSRIIINHSNHWYSCVPVCARLIIRIYDLSIPAWYYQGSNWEHYVSSFKHTFPPNCSSQFLIVHVWHLCVLRWPTNSNVVSCLHNMTCVRSSRCDAMPMVGKILVFVCCKSRPIKTTVCHLWTDIIVFTFLGQLQYILDRNLGIQHCRDVLVVTGGYSWNSILARTESLNMTAEEGNRWRRLAPLLKPRYLHACSTVQLGSEVHVLHVKW